MANQSFLRRIPILQANRLPRIRTSLVVLAISLATTAAVTRYTHVVSEAKDRLRFENAVQEATNDIEQRIETYIALLRAGVALFSTRDVVGRDDFRNFVSHLDLPNRYPGIQGIGFTKHIDPAEKTAWEMSVRASGFPKFRVWPDHERPEYHSILYLEPMDRRNLAAIGYDMFTEPTRREAMARARDTGAPAASGKVTLVQEIDEQKQAGFLIYLPVYRPGAPLVTVEDRRRALEGFVYSPFRADDLLSGIFKALKHPRVAFDIYTGTEILPESLLHRSNRGPGTWPDDYKPRFTTSRTLKFAGALWTIAYTTRPEFELPSSRGYSWLALMAGLLVSALLFWLTRSQEKTAARLRLSESRLRASDERLTLALEAGRMGAWDWEISTGTVTWSRSLEEIHGLPPGGFGGRLENVQQEIVPQDRRLVAEAVARALETKGAYYAQYRIQRPDGEIRWLEARGQITLDEDGAPKRMAGVCMDVTERVTAETALRRSEKDLNDFFENATTALHWVGSDARILRANQAELKLLGYSRDEYVGRDIKDFHVDQPVIEDILQRLLRGEVIQNREARLRAKDGTIKHVLIDSNGLWQDGRFVHSRCFTRDITEQKQAQAALHASEERFRLLVESTNVIAWEADAQTGLFTYVGPAAERLLGYPVTDWYGPTFWPDHIHPDDRDWAVRYCIESAQRMSHYEFEYRMLSSDGREVWIRDLVSVVAGEDGRKMLRGFMIDITDSKRAAEQIRKLNEELETKVRDRTHELLTANRELESFCYSVAHDLRAPLRSVAGFSEVILQEADGVLNETLRDYFHRIQAASHRMSHLIDHLLDLSRLSRREMDTQTVDLSEMARAIAEDMRRLQPDRRVALAIQPGLADQGDPTLLRVVLQNLLDNAWKFTAGRTDPEIAFGAAEIDGKPVYFVRDNGAGFEMAYYDKLFGAFERLHKEEEYPGTGVGLATVQRIIHRHRGSIWAEGRVDGGACFYFTLGYAHPQARARLTSRRDGPGPAKEPALRT
jgi:PAS domain S-box-containing protein